MRFKEFAPNLTETTFEETPVAIAVLGAPASGKSFTVKKIKQLATTQNKKLATALSTGNDLTVDKLRAEFQNLSPNEQLVDFYKSYGYMKMLAEKNPKTYQKWLTQIQNTWKKIDALGDDFTTAIDPNGNLQFNDLTNGNQIISAILQIPEAKAKAIVDQLDKYEDYKRVVRWFQNEKQEQSKKNKQNIVYDEAGDEPDKIIERFTALRSGDDPYITSIFLLHGPSPATNLIQNAGRMVSGTDGGRDSSNAIIEAWNAVEQGLNSYLSSSEREITIRGTDAEITKIFNMLVSTNTDDNTPDKAIDLLVRIETQNPKDAYARTAANFNSDPLADQFFNAILVYQVNNLSGMDDNTKRTLLSLVNNKVTNQTLNQVFDEVVKSERFNFPLNNLARMASNVAKRADTLKKTSPNQMSTSAPKPYTSYKKVAESVENSKKKVFCDVDGVLADFDKFVLKYTPKFTNNWQDLPIHTFAMLDEMPEAAQLVAYLNKNYKDNVYILTAIPKPSRGEISKVAKHDKIVWLLTHFNIPKENIFVVFREEKAYFAKNDPNHILIDDTPNNIRMWKDAGGTGILFRGVDDCIKKLKQLD